MRLTAYCARCKHVVTVTIGRHSGSDRDHATCSVCQRECPIGRPS